MSWAVGFDANWQRDIGYGVPATCDQPECRAKIDRGLAYVCGSAPKGGEHGCGLYFCEDHRDYGPAGAVVCERCASGDSPFIPTPDTDEWTNWKMTDPSWAQWRKENGK
jgi:hypothetical protein